MLVRHMKTRSTHLTRKRQQPILIAAFLAGIAACAWFGWQWSQATHWSMAQLQESVQINIRDLHAGSGQSQKPTGQQGPPPPRIREQLLRRLNKPWRLNRLHFFAALIFTLIAGGILAINLRSRPAEHE